MLCGYINGKLGRNVPADFINNPDEAVFYTATNVPKSPECTMHLGLAWRYGLMFCHVCGHILVLHAVKVNQ